MLGAKKLNDKVHGTTNKIPALVLSKEKLNPLSREFQLPNLSYRRISKDYLISFEGNKYSVPSNYAGRDASEQATGQILSNITVRTLLHNI